MKTYQHPSARIHFGALNSSPLLNYLYSFFSSNPKIPIEKHLSILPLLERYIEPHLEAYYIGAPGGYGANLRTRINGYHINAEGMRLIVESREKKDIPIIHTQEAFKKFISDTPLLIRAVAILDYGKVMVGYTYYPSEYMAIMYEKKHDFDAVYFYSSKKDTSLDMVDAGVYDTYFNKTTHLCFPSEARTDYTDFDCHPTFAAEDAIRLSSFDRTPLLLEKNRRGFFFSKDETPHSKVRVCQFTLDDVFKYRIEQVTNDHVDQIIRHANEGGLSLSR